MRKFLTFEAPLLVVLQVHSLASPDWQLMFLKEGQQSPPLSLTKARQLGYRLHFAPGRVVLRTPYNGPLSLLTTVNVFVVCVCVPSPV